MKRLYHLFLVAAIAASLASCSKGRNYTSPCADLEVRGVITNADGAGLGSMNVCIAHTVKGSDEYTYTSEDVITTSADGSFLKTYSEFHPKYTNLKLMVSDPSGKYRDKTVFYTNLVYYDADGLYEGFCQIDFSTVTLYPKK